MKLPGFGGECSLGASRRKYRTLPTGATGGFDGVVPAYLDDVSEEAYGADDDGDDSGEELDADDGDESDTEDVDDVVDDEE